MISQDMSLQGLKGAGVAKHSFYKDVISECPYTDIQLNPLNWCYRPKVENYFSTTTPFVTSQYSLPPDAPQTANATYLQRDWQHQ